MKKLWILCLIGLWSLQAYATPISLKDAVKKHQISIVVKGNGGYNGECLAVSVKNQTNYPLKIQVDAGTIFASADEDVQDLMVTQEELFALKPRGSALVNLFTMCIQHSNMGPSKGDLFTFSSMATGDLLKLVKLIDEKDYQNSTAQSAVWAITDGASIADVYGSDTAMVRKLAEVISSARGVGMSAFDFRPRRHQITSFKSSLEVVLPAYMPSASLKIYEVNTGRVFREIFAGKPLKPGFHQFRFGLHHTLGDSAAFVIKLESNEVIAEKTATISDTIPSLQPLTETFVTFDLDKPTKVQHGIYNQDDVLYAMSEPGAQLMAGFHRFDFVKSRGLPYGQTYFFKVKDMEGNVLASQEIFLDKKTNKVYRPMTKRGVYRFRMEKDDPKYDLKLAIYDHTDRIIWVVFSDSRMQAGMKQIPYVFQHRQGPDAKFTIKLTDKDGKVLKEKCIQGCK